MSNTRWQLRERDGKFFLNIQTDSRVREEREILWEGELEVRPSGSPSLKRMELIGVEGNGALEDEQPRENRKRVIRDFLTGNSTNSGSIRDIIRKTAIICESQSITFEEQEADRVRREKENQERTLQTITELRDLIALGGQRVDGETAGAR